MIRTDLNVPMHEGTVTDDTRIHASLPTLNYLREQQARCIVCSHAGRPKGEVREELRLDPVRDRLSELLGVEVKKTGDCIGDEVNKAVEQLLPGEVLLLENTRFHPEEKKNDPDFARKLSEHGEIFVNDAFASAHRAHASTEGVAHYLPSYAGLLMMKELEVLSSLLQNPDHPSIAIMGGAKAADKIGVISRLLPDIDMLLVGGVPATTLMKAKGMEIGVSIVDNDALDDARSLIEKAGNKLVMPIDVLVTTDISVYGEAEMHQVTDVPLSTSIIDIGAETSAMYKKKLEKAGTVVWNGPLGIAEIEQFAQGTLKIMNKLSEIDATVVVGGGDTVAVIQKAGKKDAFTHVSTGGDAFLEFLEGKELPGIAVLQGEFAEAAYGQV
ncbi:MAG: phosphoglycerate kinase [Chitinivibrionales bacterium]|nr:phosphoglycerate kinase [Chitinivibrionales bacterium]